MPATNSPMATSQIEPRNGSGEVTTASAATTTMNCRSNDARSASAPKIRPASSDPTA